MEEKKLHIVIILSPGMGHLIPVILLGNHLFTHHNVHVTIVVVTTQASQAESQLLSSLSTSDNLNIIKIPAADISGLVDPDAMLVTRLTLMMRETRPTIRSAISSMNPHPNVLIADLFSTESFLIADEFDMPKYVFIPTSAWFVALTTYSRVLDKEVEGEYVDQKEPLKIPGCKSVRPEDVVDCLLDRNNQQYREFIRMGIDFSQADGILLNTWKGMERASLEAVSHDERLRYVVKAPVYNIGPLSRAVEPAEAKNELTEWLDMQPIESVLYVSFGSGGTISVEQITELAWGLESSQQRFVWVVRPPAETTVDGAYFTAGDGADGTPDYLPQGFLTRTHKLGFVVPMWAPQEKILNHPSVGGFLTHCGWNSILESIASGVPMIAWPLYAEQRLNAIIITEEHGVAVRPEVWSTKKAVGREEIEKMVRTLIQYKEGKAMREKVKELRKSGEEALSNGGSSYISMCEFIKDCRFKILSHKEKKQN